VTPDEPPGAIESISAVTLATADMDTSVEFYEAMGFEPLYGGRDSAFTSFRVGSGYLNIQADPAHAPVPSIWGRVIFYVDDVDAVFHRAVEAGYSPEMDPVDAPWGERHFHLRDPDGHELSFARPLLA
jgi:catechol 2,3-dioxygenase-like lactoylglutathione lyase family enzyme